MKPLLLITIFFIGFSTASFAQTQNKKHIVEIRKMKFKPAVLNVKKGDTVVWINRDFFPHDVAGENGESWQSSPLEKGQTFTRIITKSENYFCPLHIVMKGKLIVE